MIYQRARGPIALVAALLTLLAGRTYADVAGTGTFDISLNVGIPTTTFNGMIFFDAGTRSVFGQNVDLAANVGDMSYDGTAQVSLQSRSATFEFDAGPANEFAFHAAGAGACDQTGCLNGQATFAGVFDSLTDPMDGATIEGKPRFESAGFYYDTFPLYVQGCVTGSGSGPCERSLGISAGHNNPIGPEVLQQGEGAYPFINYTEVTSDFVLQDYCNSLPGTTVEILGLTGNRLRGRFSGPLSCQSSFTPLAINGTFDVPLQNVF